MRATPYAESLGDLTWARIRELGAPAEAWAAGLDATLGGLAGEWRLTLGGVLPGGSASIVVEATSEAGEARAIKLPMPGVEQAARQVEVLAAAAGRGYVQLFARDEASGALLLERLGPQLASRSLDQNDENTIIVATLIQAWRTPATGLPLETGAEKAQALAEFIETQSERFPGACAPATVQRALDYCEARRRAFDPDKAVLGHGDCHAWNTLAATSLGPDGHKFVDPDGIFIEPAYDLGICMREHSDMLLAGDTLALGHALRDHLAGLTGVEPTAIWHWGFTERVSTGLLIHSLGMPDRAAPFLKVAEAWTAS